MVEQFLPHPPEKGPPVPRRLPGWPWLKNPGNPVADPAVHDTTLDAEIEDMTHEKNEENPTSQDDYVIVLKKRNPNPVWLKEHQKRLAEASKRASELTKHLKGEKRVRERQDIISRMLKDSG